MISLPIIILLATGIFVIGLSAQNFSRLKFCAVCVAVSGTWFSLWLFYKLGFFVDKTVIGILMGESIIGLYYLLEKRLPSKWQIFRWPYIITMTSLVALMVGMRTELYKIMILLLIVWIIFIAIYIFANYPTVKKIAQRLLACCRDW
jgi:hypothetical protein